MATEPESPQKRASCDTADILSEKLLFRRLAIVFGLLAAVTGVLGIFTAHFGITFVSSLNQSYKTLSLSAALIWIFLGSVLAYQAAKPLQRISGLVVQVILFLIAAVETIEFVFTIQGSHFFIETLLVGIGTSIIGPTSSPISPAAAGLAVLAAIALVVIIRDSGLPAKSTRIPDTISIVSLAISLVSFTFILSYLYGNPLLYGTQFIPIAFLSALAAFFVGVALIAAAGPVAVPARYMIGNSISARLLRVFVPLVAYIILVENFALVGLSSWFNIRDAVLFSTTLVVFILATAFVVAKVSGAIGGALERAEQELVRKNEDLGAMNEELTSIQHDLQANENQLRTDLEAMETLQKISMLYIHEGNLEPILTEVVDAAIAITGADFGNIQLVDPELSGLRIAAHRGFPEWWLNYWNSVSKGKGTCGTALAQGERVIVGDIEQSPIFIGTPALDIQLRAGVRAVQSTPLKSREGKPLGMFSTHFKVPHRPDGRQLRLLDLLARQAADIIERAQSQEILLKKNEDLNAAYEEIASTEEELRQTNDVLLANERHLVQKNEDLNVLNEELNAAHEELRQNIEELSLREQELTRSEVNLREALAEKEVLLSEIHHRVKNNLTAFISLLSLDGSYKDTDGGRALRLDLQNRARSMALIHETLYRTGKFSKVDMDVYLNTLASQVASSYEERAKVRIVVDVRDVALDISRATTAGLIVNELVTNSFKYAFPPGFDCMAVRGEPCTIQVSVAHEDGTDILTVADNGRGLPEGFDPLTTKSFGLKLVNFLARHQLRAEISIQRDKGTAFIFRMNKGNI